MRDVVDYMGERTHPDSEPTERESFERYDNRTYYDGDELGENYPIFNDLCLDCFGSGKIPHYSGKRTPCPNGCKVRK